MLALQLLPIVLSLLALGAHFLRDGRLVLVVAVLVVLGLLFVRRRWAARVVQATLTLGTVVWIHTLVTFAAMRLQAGEPVRRLVIILVSVAVVSLLSAWLMQVGRLRRRYGLDRADGRHT